jgi:hypothetical protein
MSGELRKIATPPKGDMKNFPLPPFFPSIFQNVFNPRVLCRLSKTLQYILRASGES